MAAPSPPARREEAGFSLVALVAAVAIMLILMGAAVPSWRYVMKDAREEELLFRGIQIAEAVERYQRKHGGAPPNSLEDLVKGRFLRKAWKDPMTRDGKWRLVRPGEAAGMRLRRGRFRNRLMGDELGGDRASFGGGFVGVASTSPDQSLRIFNGQTRYEEWLFVAGQPRVVGKQPTIGGPLPRGLPGVRPEGVGGSLPGKPERPSERPGPVERDR